MALEDTWNDAVQQSQFIAKASGVQGLLQRQTARIEPLITSSNADAKKITRTIYWQNACDIVAAACANDECVAATIELTDGSKDVTLASCREASFVTSWKVHRTVPHNHATTIATGLLKATKELDEYLAAQFVSFVDANKGTHEYTIPGSTITGDVAQIAAASWTDSLIPEFENAAEFSRFGPYFMLDGLNTWSIIRKANSYVGNADGKGEKDLWNSKDWVFDRVNMQANATTDTRTYMIDNAAIALATGNYYDAPTEFGGNHRVYKVPSRNLPGVAYDVHEMETCGSNDFVNSFRVRVNFDFFLNPLGCVAGRKGILAYEKV